MFSSLIIAGREWLWPALGLLVAAIGLLVWSYRTAQPGVARWLCPSLKVAGFAMLAFSLLEPLWASQRARPGANLFLMVADNSQGLRIKDRGETRTRGELMGELLDAKRGAWQAQLEQDFELRRYIFDSRLQPASSFSELDFSGKSSALGSALREVGERARGKPAAGVLLLTDGNATDMRSVPDLAGYPPIYPVVVGRSEAIRDLALAQVRSAKTDFEDAPVNIQADVSATGYGGVNVTAQVLEPSGKVIAEQTARATKETELLGFQFRIKPEKRGLSFYKVQVRARHEAVDGAPPQSEEATLANNEGYVAVDRGSGPYRILYVSGRPNWEFKFLNRALDEDEQVQMSALIRVARREPRFNFIGRAGETSNPLFRGFGTQSEEEVERYDQPVLVRLNTKDEHELRTGFPAKPEDLFAYNAIIVDDLEAAFFSADQTALVQRFVAERGGGFLMLGGMESFQQGKYFRTPIGDMLPVYLDRTESAGVSGPLRMELTREGFLQPWARLRDNEADEKERQQTMAPFQVLNPIREVKPGASVIARASDAKGQSYPAWVVQRFGHGRTAAVLVGDVWRWGFRDEDAHRDMAKAWRQFIRWLVTDAPARVEVASEPRPAEGDGAVSIQIKVRDPKFQPMDNASVSVEVRPVIVDAANGAQTNVIRLAAEPSAKEPGVYQASYVSRGAGAYRAIATVVDESGVQTGRAQTGWATDLASEEFHSLKPNTALLEELARRTGGRVLNASDLADFAKELPRKSAPVMEPWNYPVWHTPVFFMLALGCFVSEWGLRRWKGLP